MNTENINNQSIVGTVMGFISVIYADVSGWLTVLSLNISFQLEWMQYMKLFAAPFIGATVGYFTPKFWNLIIRKLKSLKKKC
jgi:hypothetical protein